MGLGNYVEGVNPDVIRWAREKAGFTIEEISLKLNKKASIIEEWENGISLPTYNQLEDLAYRFYKRPLAIFFFPDPPTEEDLEKSFRTMPNVEIENISPNVRYLIREAEYLQITLNDINNQKNPFDKNIFKDISVSINSNVVSVIEEIRRYLEIGLNDQIAWKSNYEALNNWRDAIEKSGIFIFKNAFKQDDISGFCLYDSEFPIIYLNNSNSFSRQIFTIFHELFHLLLKSNDISKNTNEYLSLLSGDELQIEILCNKFASHFLVPPQDFDSRIPQGQIDIKIIEKLAKLYHVSREVISRNFLNRGLLTQYEYEELSSAWSEEFLRNHKEKGGGDYYNTQYSYYGKNFLNLLFKKHYEGIISIEQVAENMNMKVQNVSKLEQLMFDRQM